MWITAEERTFANRPSIPVATTTVCNVHWTLTQRASALICRCECAFIHAASVRVRTHLLLAPFPYQFAHSPRLPLATVNLPQLLQLKDENLAVDDQEFVREVRRSHSRSPATAATAASPSCDATPASASSSPSAPSPEPCSAGCCSVSSPKPSSYPDWPYCSSCRRSKSGVTPPPDSPSADVVRNSPTVVIFDTTC